MLGKLQRLAYRYTDGMFRLYLKHLFVKSAIVSIVIESLFVLYTVTAIGLSPDLFYLFVWNVWGLAPWWFVFIFGVLIPAVFLHAIVLFFRILIACSDYELACFNAARTEGPPKPFNLDQ